METDEDDPLLSPPQVYAWLGIAESTLRRWRAEGRGPAYITLSPRVIRYRRSVVLAWLREQEHSPGSPKRS